MGSRFTDVFNVDKCKVPHIGNRNVQANYTMNGIQLAKVEQEEGLGGEISSDLKPSKQCPEIVKTTNKLIGFIGRSFEFRTEEIILNLYSALIRAHLEYCVQCWSPYYKKDIEQWFPPYDSNPNEGHRDPSEGRERV